jgi:hypothetical protein
MEYNIAGIDSVDIYLEFLTFLCKCLRMLFFNLIQKLGIYNFK